MGITDAFLKNAETLGVNLDEVNTIVLSHGRGELLSPRNVFLDI